ncbi:hypothetical protein IQ66_05450 [Leptospira borgpetersenii serovar Ballum]|nr:hypothetical protein IQ66_05450 [Leptospira borgpetersenii serovar Ballum]
MKTPGRKTGKSERMKAYFSNPTLTPESPVSLLNLLGLLALADFASFPRLKQWYFAKFWLAITAAGSAPDYNRIPFLFTRTNKLYSKISRHDPTSKRILLRKKED